MTTKQNTEDERALLKFLEMLDRDIAAKRNVVDLPEALATAMHRAMHETSVALDEILDGEVAI